MRTSTTEEQVRERDQRKHRLGSAVPERNGGSQNKEGRRATQPLRKLNNGDGETGSPRFQKRI